MNATPTLFIFKKKIVIAYGYNKYILVKIIKISIL